MTIGIILLVVIVVLILRAIITSSEQKKKEFKGLADWVLSEIEQLKNAQSAAEYVNIWNSLVKHVEKLQSTYKTSYGYDSWKYINEAKNSIKEMRDDEEFYWMLRNAIDRNKNKAIKNIKTTYKNSEKYKQIEYQKFCEDIDFAKYIFNEETTDFANACIDEVSYALGGTSSRRMPSKDEYVSEQRRLMTPSLRYDIMKRDGFRCVICGRGAEDGVKLHVDHIKPVSKGGKTTPSNLRTLCQDCNIGKSAKYDSDDSAYSIDELEMYSAIDDD